jgi:anthranilate phosphoribosyltransferase
MLGPLVNPSLPQNQIVGVFDLKVMRLYHYIYQDLDRQYVIIHSLDGYDEISLTSPFKLIGNTKEEIMEPESIGFTRLKQNEITGGESIEDAAQTFLSVLKNRATDAQINVVIANSAMAIHCIQPELTITDCIDKARISIEEGKAFQSFNTLLSIN